MKIKLILIIELIAIIITGFGCESSDKFYQIESLDNQSACSGSLSANNISTQLDQNNSSIWIDKGNSLQELGQYEEAILCYDKALKIIVKNLTN
jgi:tetratricopeptide (TPR) repeat protein